ncbi:MAG: hypothetical protein Q9162_005655 [Coniocarpon cinnabarinum]
MSSVSETISATPHNIVEHDTAPTNHVEQPQQNADLPPSPQTHSRPTSSELEEPSSSTSVHDMNDQDYNSDLDQDAEGSPDEDAPLVPAPTQQPPSEPLGTSSDDSESRKRKREGDIEDDIQQNPELYGLRRSNRPRAAPKRSKTSDSSEDSDDIDTRPAGARRKAKQGRRSKKSTSAPQSSLSDESDLEDEFGSKKDKAKRRKQNRVRNGTPLAPAERSSTRNAASKVTNYVDDDGLSEEFLESDAGDDHPGYYYDDRPAIDLVLLHRRVTEGDDSEPTLAKFEYCIKWQGQARYHASWEKHVDLKDRTGGKKLNNYFDKNVRNPYYLLHDPDASPEDKEVLKLEQKAHQQKLDINNTIQRVIDERHLDTEDGTILQYFVKWSETDYNECTWENMDLVADLAPRQLEWFKERQARPDIISKSTKAHYRYQTKEYFKSQPSYVKHGTMRDFQLTGLSRMAIAWSRGINTMLADEMGLGKTVQTVAFMSWLKNDCDIPGPFLVIAPKSVLPAWEDTLTLWAPDVNWVTYTGTNESRGIIEEKELFVDPSNPFRLRFNVLLTTYEMFHKGMPTLKRLKWQFLAVDEAHRLKSMNNHLYLDLQQCDIASRLLITGTPFQNDFSELVALLSFLQPEEHFETKYNFKTDDVNLQARQIEGLRQELRRHLVRRTKEEVAGDLPPKTEKIIRVELSDLQLQYYKNLLTRNYEALSQASNGAKIGLSNLMIELKKASIHPYLFPNVEEVYLNQHTAREDVLRGLIVNSGKMMLLDQLMTKLKKDGHRVLIFSGFVSMLNLIGQYLQLRDHKYQRLDGSTPTPARNHAMSHFNAPDSEDFAFLLSTRAGGLGINLYTADTVILFDSDWNPQADLQAMARAHRIGQTKPVTIYRFVSRDTIEEEILERARNKLLLEYITIQRGFNQKETNEFKKKMQSEGRSMEEAKGAEDISRILQKRGKKMFEQASNQKKLEDLDIDAVLEHAEETKTQQMEGVGAMNDDEFLNQFAYEDITMDKDDWDSIIPKSDRDRLADEDRKRKDAELARKMNEEGAPRSAKSKSFAATGKRDRSVKKRPGELVEAPVSDGESNDDDSKSDSDVDPDEELTDREFRRLMDTFKAIGYFEDRPEDFLKLSRLQKKNPDLVKASLQEVIDIAQSNIDNKSKELQSRADSNDKSMAKKNQKAVLFEHKGVRRINSATILRRPYMLRTLKQFVDKIADIPRFTIPQAIKDSQFDTEWGPREDAMLAVGVARYGHGQWRKIMADPELGMQGKFFLDEAHVAEKSKRDTEGTKSRTPAGPHLVRRADYLLDVVVDIATDGADKEAHEAVINHHRNNKRDIDGDPETLKRQKRRERDSKLKARKEQEKYQEPGRASGSPSHDRHRDRTHVNGHDSSTARTSGASSPRPRADSKAFKHRLSNGDRPRSPLVTHGDGTGDRPDHVKHHARPQSSQGTKRKSDHMDASEHDLGRPNKARVSEGVNHPVYNREHSGHKSRSPEHTKNGVNSAGPSKESSGSLDFLMQPITEKFPALKTEYLKFRHSADPVEKLQASGPMQKWIELVITFIDDRHQTYGGSFETRCWDHVGKFYWFGLGVDGSKLLEMSKKVRSTLAARAREQAQKSNEPSARGVS